MVSLHSSGGRSFPSRTVSPTSTNIPQQSNTAPRWSDNYHKRVLLCGSVLRKKARTSRRCPIQSCRCFTCSLEIKHASVIPRPGVQTTNEWRQAARTTPVAFSFTLILWRGLTPHTRFYQNMLKSHLVLHPDASQVTYLHKRESF